MGSVHCEKAGVLVLGGGGAALRAAIAAAEYDKDLKVLLASKGQFGRSGVTANACSDRMAFHAVLPTTEPGGADAWRYHADDVFRIGGYVSDYDLAETQARQAASAFDYLDRLGVPWVRRPDGSVDQFVTDGSQYARACYTGPHTANHIEEALVRRTRQLPNLHVLEHVCAAELLSLSDGGIAGAMLVSEKTGELIAVAANAVILATGGAGQVYGLNVFTPDCTGDGYALAYRAGAELVNMEFIQIGLCSLATGLAMSGDAMRAWPRLVNDKGEEFLRRYFPSDMPVGEIYAVLFDKGASWPVSFEHVSHIIDMAVTYERADGRCTYLDYSTNPAGFSVNELPEKARWWYKQVKGVSLGQAPYRDSPLARLRAINSPSVRWLAERGVDLERGDMVEIAPAAQHFQGGVKIRTYSETTLPGLFAAGEVAGGQHGANRPGGNALMDCQVFGRIAGESAARLASGRCPHVESDAIEKAVDWLTALTGGNRPARQVRAELQHLMDRNAGVVRVEERLREGIEHLQKLPHYYLDEGAHTRVYATETCNLLCVAEMVLRAALAREESRGPHVRFVRFGDLEPLPSSDVWRRYIVIQRAEGGMQLQPRLPIQPPNIA